MSRLLPRSLFAQLTLILLVGLLLAQLAGAWILLQERLQVLYAASGLHSAQRIAELVSLLDAMEPAERRRLAAAFNTPALHLWLQAEPRVPPEHPAGAGALDQAFRGLLARHLGPDRELRVQVLETAGAPVHTPLRGGMGRGPHMAGAGLPGVAFLAQVRLADGTWAGFDQRVPQEVFAWPPRVLGALAILLVTVVALSLLAVRWVTRPLSALAAAATRLGRDLHAAPLPETGPDEVVHAARAFNTMQARITRYLEDRSRTLAALSHDLKTPLTRLRLRAEALEPAELRAQVLQDLAEMHAMTVSTLDFLRGGDEREPVQPVDLLALAESLKADAEELGQEVQVLGSPGAPFRARPLALKRCLTNLVDNAVRYGGRAAIHLEEAPGALLVRVTDEGPGIPEAEIERVFEPFYRLEGSRGRQTGGSGLGLTIARNLARAHGGELTLRNRPAGGLEAVLTLPQ